MRLLPFCAALALGEAAAALMPQFAPLWSSVALGVLLVALIGYGLAFRGWHYVSLALLGASLFLAASEKREDEYRFSPWLRNVARHEWKEPSGVKAPMRRNLSQRVGLGLEYNRTAVALNRAILLGERARVPLKLKRVFVESGTIHVFAISGLHVMAMAKLFSVLLALLLIPHRLTGVLSLPLVWGYVWIIDFPPSAVRAALMVSVYFAAPVYWRRSDAIQAWSLAFLTMHLCDPTLIRNCGSQLSFAVMLGILLVSRYGSCLCGGWRLKLLVTFAAWLAGVPISAYAFGRLSPVGILANLLLITIATLTVITGVIGVVLSFVSTWAAVHFNALAAIFTDLMVVVAEMAASIPGGGLEVKAWNYWSSIGVTLVLVLGIWLLRSLAKRKDLI